MTPHLALNRNWVYGVCTAMAVSLLSAPRLYAGEEPPMPLDRALARARSTGRPLIVELGATWCAPCRTFAKSVLPRPNIQAALKDVVFIRYDIDSGPGREMDRYRNRGAGRSYPVPVFFALDEKAEVKHTYVGAPLDDRGIAVFLAFVGDSRVRLQSDEKLRSALKARPDDPVLNAGAARRAVERGEYTLALSHYDKVVAAKEDVPTETKAEIHAEALRLRRFEATRSQLVRDTADLVRNYPGAKAVLSRLALATIGSGLPEAEVKELYAAVFAAISQPTSLRRAVYLALAAGARNEAQAGARKLVADAPSPGSLNVLAETHHALGQKAEALRVEDEALAKAQGSLRESLVMQRVRFESKAGGEAPEVTAEREKTARYWKELLKAEEVAAQTVVSPAAGVSALETWKSAADRVLREAARRCQGEAVGRLSEVYVRLYVSPDPGPAQRIVVLEPDAPPNLKNCLYRALLDAPLPAAPMSLKGRYTAPITFYRPSAIERTLPGSAGARYRPSFRIAGPGADRAMVNRTFQTVALGKRCTLRLADGGPLGQQLPVALDEALDPVALHPAGHAGWPLAARAR